MAIKDISTSEDDIQLNRLSEHTRQRTVTDNDNAPSKPVSSDKPKRGSRFWLILTSLCLSLFLSALEFTAVSTALPIIAADLHGASFIWVGTAYALASSAILPMTGGVAQIFGRRPAMVAAIFFFALGSAICGAAQSMSMLIAGRAVQGMGGGGILSFSAIILADLVPLRERGVFAGLFGLTWSLAAAIGPVVGGSLSNEAGSALLILVRLPTPPGTVRGKLLSLDWITLLSNAIPILRSGAFIIIGSTTGITIALTDGGVNDPWPSANILSPLIIGLVGLIVFLVYEARFAKNPLVPWGILANRTSASGYAQTFLLPVTSLAVIYYLPVYFQACKGADASRSGVLLLSMSSVALGAMVGGRSTKFIPRYRPQIWLGWVLQTIGISLLTIIKLETHVGVAVGFVIIYGTGAGINYALQVYPIQAPLPVTSNAHALSFFSFMRTFAGVRYLPSP
ncbi:hypothetical protein Clacol_005194 [Clathrus columnatus]|uniref:Major facilitator superfamily (MFS) profile domain-containing protein n=1 Tax=Clathrus columnatus TaxID=1419009 RepID=A0AAV5A9F6_9AGAM|nr:hypothetical protein Clacol_005194 [Clathrus columnatus]